MDTVRLLTPRGLAAVAVVRLPDLDSLPEGMQLRTSRGWLVDPPEVGSVRRAQLLMKGRVLDDTLVVGTDRGVELHVHGSAGVLDALLDRARETTPGVMPRPRSWRSARVALSNACGPAARLVVDAKAALDQGRADAALVDRLRVARSRASLGGCLACPPRVDLVGPPNAGKSTLFNALIGFERALVSPRAGTTRDAVGALWLLRDVPVELQDTAGVDGDHPSGRADLQICLKAWPDTWVSASSGNPGRLEVVSQSDRAPDALGGALALSARTGAGLSGLLDALAARLEIPEPGPEDLLAVLDPRDLELLDRAAELPVA